MKPTKVLKSCATVALPALLIAGCTQLSAEDRALLEEVRMTAEEAKQQSRQAADEARAAREAAERAEASAAASARDAKQAQQASQRMFQKSMQK